MRMGMLGLAISAIGGERVPVNGSEHECHVAYGNRVVSFTELRSNSGQRCLDGCDSTQSHFPGRRVPLRLVGW